MSSAPSFFPISPEIKIIKQTFGPVSEEEIKRKDPAYLMKHVEKMERERDEMLQARIAARKKRSRLVSVLNGIDLMRALNFTPKEIAEMKADDNLMGRPLFAAPQSDESPVDVWDCLTLCGKVRHFVESRLPG